MALVDLPRRGDGAFAFSSGGDGTILAGVGFSWCLFWGVVVDYALPDEKRYGASGASHERWADCRETKASKDHYVLCLDWIH